MQLACCDKLCPNIYTVDNYMRIFSSIQMQFQWLFYLGKMENKKWQITLIFITDNIKKKQFE